MDRPNEPTENRAGEAQRVPGVPSGVPQNLPVPAPAAQSSPPTFGPPPPRTGYGHGPYGPAQVAPKSPGLALLASFFIPGVGSMMNGDSAKGVLILVASFVSWLLFWLTIWFLVGIVFVVPMLGLWIWGMVDAYTGAQRWNARYGIIS